jgi:hypothetical protein
MSRHMLLLTHAMIASFWTSDGVVQISRFVDNHRLIFEGVLIVVALALVPASWRKWSVSFEQRHQRLLWGMVISLLLLIPVVLYLSWP